MSRHDMTVVDTTAGMKALAAEWKASGAVIGLVPTMGALHEGHIELVREARRRCSRVSVSIFVNPTQFGPGEDFEKYPRDLDGDLAKLAEVGVDAVFFPTPAIMYPPGFQTNVELTKLPHHLCGITRTNHFAGVAQVVLKLFNICKPDIAVFGMKDFQQVRVIEQMVVDLNLDVNVVRHPTVREADGLAMSSRNAYLSPRERADAVIINRTLVATAERISAGTRDSRALVESAVKEISACGGSVEYFRICSPDTLDDIESIGSETAGNCNEVLLVCAVRFGMTRLIDNRLARVPGPAD